MPNLDLVEARTSCPKNSGTLTALGCYGSGSLVCKYRSVGHFTLYCYSIIKYPTENDYSLEAFNGDDVGSDSLPVDGLIKGARVDSVGEWEGCTT